RSSNIVQFKFAGILNSDYRSERKRIIQSWRYVRPVSSHDRNSYDWCARAHGDACITMHLVGGRDHTARGSDTKLTCGYVYAALSIAGMVTRGLLCLSRSLR